MPYLKKIVVFTDLDATLLDPVTYSWEPAIEALNLLLEINASLVLVSSKTFSEMVSIHEALGFNDPFIVENGGGIVFGSSSTISPGDLGVESQLISLGKGRHKMLSLGANTCTLLNFLKEFSRSIDVPLRSYFEMSMQEISELTNLSYVEVLKSLDRYFDVPFFFVDRVINTDEQRLVYTAISKGLNVVRGGRFWHLMGHHGKGYAVELLLSGYRRKYGAIDTIGLGDSPNDYSFLRHVDHPIILGGMSNPSLFGYAMPEQALKTMRTGPKEWNVTILNHFRSKRSRENE